MYSHPEPLQKRFRKSVTRVVISVDTLRCNFSQLKNQKNVNTLRLAGVENGAYFNILFSQKVRSENILTVPIFTAGSALIKID